VKRFEGRGAVVTGAGGAIGGAIARRLAEEGAGLIVADVRLDAAAEMAAAITAAGGVAVALAVDVSKSADVDAAVQAAVERYGHLDVMVNNAGTHLQALVAETSDEEWERVQRTNAFGSFYGCRAAMRVMRKQRSGSIINIITGLFGVAYSSAYVSSKSAIWGLSQCLTLEAAPFGVRVNCIVPGSVPDTGFNRWYREKAEISGLGYERFMEIALETTPLGRFGTPLDMANAVAFLASEEASFITGHALEVAGGFTGYAVPIKTD
jgi:NAD(P)-dependent dehydrogenase (short-subunit alcohol dehydrogenase family)